jgi:hypothetical protein
VTGDHEGGIQGAVTEPLQPVARGDHRRAAEVGDPPPHGIEQGPAGDPVPGVGGADIDPLALDVGQGGDVAGGSTLILDNSGIKLQGSTIRINSGGATAPALFPSQVKMLLPTALSAIKIATFKKKTFSEECEKITDDICNFGSQAKGSKSDQDSTLINTGTNSFTLEQKQKIQEAIYNQKTMLSNKKEELIRWNENDQEKFKSAFGTTDENARKTILYRVNKEIEYNKSLNLNSFDKTNENIYAKIEGWKDHGKIHLGEKFWTNSKNDGAESTAGVLSHEISHIYNIGPTQDHFPDYNHGKDIYYKENSHMLANKRPDLALKHADSFEYYLEDK